MKKMNDKNGGKNAHREPKVSHNTTKELGSCDPM